MVASKFSGWWSSKKNVSDCLAEALGTCQLEPGVEVKESYQRDLPQVMATREKLVETFCHVIGNALDAVELSETGQLRIETRPRSDRLVEPRMSA